MTTPALHLCLGAECPGLEGVPTVSSPHPMSCSASGCASACEFEDVQKREPVSVHMQRANQACRDEDEEALEMHMRRAIEQANYEYRIQGYTQDLEAQMGPEEMP